MAESGLVFQDINKLDEVNRASNSDVLILTDKQSNNATIIDYLNFVSTLLDEINSKNYTLDAGRQTLINALNSLNTRINNITAGSGADGVSQAEIVDARTTESTLIADRLVESSYPILGEAIRAQINALYNEIQNIATEYIENDAVTTAKIANGNVTTAKLADNAVTTSKIADGAVKTVDIADSNVTTAKIADSNVTTAKIADNAVTSAKIADGAVGTSDLANSAVTNAKINNGAVGFEKLATAVQDRITTAESEIDDLEERKADKDGDYAELTAGGARQLLSTVYVDDNEPYNFRTAGGSADIGDRMYEEVVGGTVVWNQKVVNGNFASKATWQTVNTFYSVSNNVATVTINNATSTPQFFQFIDTIVGHKYYISADMNPSKNGRMALRFGNIYYQTQKTADAWTNESYIRNANATRSEYNCYINGEDYVADDTIQLRNCVCIDLTQMFGSTIADYIYSLEQGTAGAGVAWFRKLFPKPYYEYNAGELMSVKAGSHDTVGFNAWDEEWELGGIDENNGQTWTTNDRIRCKNFIPVIGGATYYIKAPNFIPVLVFYDADKNFISSLTSITQNYPRTMPENCAFIKFQMASNYGTTYKNDICINLSWDGERNGEYEPYEKHEYPLAELELRGVPKLDANNQLYYDGDTYASDGTVTRKYGIVDLGTLNNWGYNTTWGDPVFTIQLANDVAVFKAGSKVICSKYTQASEGASDNATAVSRMADKQIQIKYTNTQIYIMDSAYTDVATFKTAMRGVYLVYELAEPTTETADTFVNPQVVDDFGTEEYTDYAVEAGDRDVAIPVGHNSQYMNNLRAKLEMSPNSPSGDGKYIVQQSNGENAYIPYTADGRLDAIEAKLPAPPSTNGTYKLTATVTSNGVSYTWVAG